MRGKVIGLVLVVLALLLVAMPGLAAAKGGGAPRFFSLDGEITLLDSSIWVEVLDSNPLVPDVEELQVLVTEETLYWRCTGEGREYLEYADLQQGWVVFIHGTRSSSNGDFIFTAERVVVDKPD